MVVTQARCVSEGCGDYGKQRNYYTNGYEKFFQHRSHLPGPETKTPSHGPERGNWKNVPERSPPAPGISQLIMVYLI
jgi:hypothetical protein